MAQASIRAYLAGTSTQITAAAPLLFTWLGSVTAEQEIDIINDRDGSMNSETAYNRLLGALAKTFGSSDAPVASGKEFLDQYHLEARIKAGYGGLAVQPTGWTALGPSSRLPLPGAIAKQKGVRVGLRVKGRSGASNAHLEVHLVLDGPEGVPIGDGHTEYGKDGVLSGVGDDLANGLWKIAANIVQNPAGANNQIQVPELFYQIAGVTYSRERQLLAINQNDKNGAALAAGEAYYAAVSLPEDDTHNALTVTKGAKVAVGSLDADDEPAWPEGEEPLAMLRVDYHAGGGLIEDADISQRWALTGYALTGTSGRTATYSKGRARIDNRLVRHDYAQSILVPASGTNAIYLLGDGSLSTAFVARGYTLRDGVVTDASSITNSGNERRALVGHREVNFAFEFNATLTNGLIAYSQEMPAHRRYIYLLPLEPLLAWMTDTGSGNTAGDLVFDVEYSDNGGAWTSIFTNSATRDLRPYFAYNTSSPLLMAKVDSAQFPHPQKTVIPPRARLRAKVVVLNAFNGTAPAGARLLLQGGLG